MGAQYLVSHLNAGYRTRISGETDFPCIYDDRVGLGRSYVRQKRLDYRDWTEGIREGRNYVSDGKSHILDFKVNEQLMGEGESELKMLQPSEGAVTARVAALLLAVPDEKISKTPLRSETLLGSGTRRRIGDTRNVPVELVVNGQAVARQEITADGEMRNVIFRYKVERSSWIALRILPSSHTNPIFVMLGGKPIAHPAGARNGACVRSISAGLRRHRRSGWRSEGRRLASTKSPGRRTGSGFRNLKSNKCTTIH